MELKIDDLLVYTYRGELELSRKGVGGYTLIAKGRIDDNRAKWHDDLVVHRVVWKNDKPVYRSTTTLGKVYHKLR